MDKKVKLGQFFTKHDVWLKSHIFTFIKNSGCNIIYDPFAGEGDIFHAFNDSKLFKNQVGFDIDENLPWKINDSLVNIPHINNAIIITNPPYIKKHSANRKKIDLNKYFSKSKYDDVYLIALEKMLEAQKFVVALVPESFINSNFKQKNKLYSITILEENPFLDTEMPICVVCFDSIQKDFKDIKVYKNDIYVSTLEDVFSSTLNPQKNISINFNDKNGWLGLRAIDGVVEDKQIKFDFKDNIKYDWNNKIKVSSRHITLISINLPDIDSEIKSKIIYNANLILNNIRNKTSDILLTPFKGNMHSGKRRRRLDYKLARGIIEKAYANTLKDLKYDQKI